MTYQSEKDRVLRQIAALGVREKEMKWTCVGSVDCFRLRTVRGEENIATNEPDLPAGVSPRSYPAC